MSLPYERAGSHLVGSAAAPLYYQLPLGVISAGVAQTLQLQHFIPVRFDNKGVIKTVGCSVSGTVASAVSRVGVYKDAGKYAPRPGELIAQVSAAFATAALGAPEGTVNAAITKPGLYWLSFAMQTANGTIRTSSGVRQAGVLLPLTTTEPAAQLVGCGYTQTSITSALASVSATATLTGVGEVPWLYFQVN